MKIVEGKASLKIKTKKAQSLLAEAQAALNEKMDLMLNKFLSGKKETALPISSSSEDELKNKILSESYGPDIGWHFDPPQQKFYPAYSSVSSYHAWHTTESTSTSGLWYIEPDFDLKYFPKCIMLRDPPKMEKMEWTISPT